MLRFADNFGEGGWMYVTLHRWWIGGQKKACKSSYVNIFYLAFEFLALQMVGINTQMRLVKIAHTSEAE